MKTSAFRCKIAQTSERSPVLSRSREILLRGEHRIVLVQVVTSEENLSRLSDQLVEILRRIEVL